MQNVRLTKHHGLGNDFLVALVDSRDDISGFDAAFARRVCHRRRGVGADGFIVGVRRPDADHDLRMALFNADGSRAEISGNGIRCLAQAELMQRAAPRAELRIATDAGLRVVAVRQSDNADTVEASVEMGTITERSTVPAPPPGYDIGKSAAADIGNPHWVVLVDDAWAVDLAAIGPQFEHAGGGVNVEFIAPTPGSHDALDLAVWERGVGITEACGSGASVAAFVAHRWGLVGTDVTVHMPGGAARVVLDGAEATLVGPSVYVALIDLPSPTEPESGAARG
jgi:diaminopimelate epimerase